MIQIFFKFQEMFPSVTVACSQASVTGHGETIFRHRSLICLLLFDNSHRLDLSINYTFLLSFYKNILPEVDIISEYIFAY